jgi:hypothetical protein
MEYNRALENSVGLSPCPRVPKAFGRQGAAVSFGTFLYAVVKKSTSGWAEVTGRAHQLPASYHPKICGYVLLPKTTLWQAFCCTFSRSRQTDTAKNTSRFCSYS